MSGLLGALTGLGQGMAQAGNTMFNNELEKMKEARLQAIRQQERSEDRQWRMEDAQTQRGWQQEDYATQRNDRLADMKMERGWKVEDRDLAFGHAEKLASMRGSGGGSDSKLPPQAKAALDLMEHLRKKAEFGDLSEEEQAQYAQAGRVYALMTGMASFGQPIAQQEAGAAQGQAESQTPTTNYAALADGVRGSENERSNRGLLGLSADQVEASPSVQRTVEGRERSNETMSRQIGNLKDRFNREMQESEQIAFRRFGDRVPAGNAEWESWLQKNYPEVYRRRVERGEIQR